MKILVLSPHYDDGPLSLGQSILDGELSHHTVTMGIVFGQSNWTRFFHPTRRRTPLATAIRLGEEIVNAFRFRYRIRVGKLQEAVLRLGNMSTDAFLIEDYDCSNDEALPRVTEQLERWVDDYDVVISPLGIGDHIDHQLVADAARSLADHGKLVAFYEDRPYACTVDDDGIAAAANHIDPRLVRRKVSGPMGPNKHERIWYPSQFDEFFLTAIDIDTSSERSEHVWVLPDAPWPRP